MKKLPEFLLLVLIQTVIFSIVLFAQVKGVNVLFRIANKGYLVDDLDAWLDLLMIGAGILYLVLFSLGTMVAIFTNGVDRLKISLFAVLHFAAGIFMYVVGSGKIIGPVLIMLSGMGTTTLVFAARRKWLSDRKK